MKIELIHNLDYKPEINTYWFWAIQLLMLKDSKNNENWLTNNFIEIVYEKEGLPRDIYFYNDVVRNKTVEFYNCPLWRTQKIDFDKKHLIFGKSIIEFVEESITHNKFVLLMVNRRFIKSYDFQGNDLHQIMIHGFDDEKQEVYYADNRRDGKFVNMLVCKYDELVNGFINSFPFEDEPDFSTSIFTFTVDSSQKYSINIFRIKRMLSSYYNCNSQTEDLRLSGINVYLDLIEYYENCIGNNLNINTDLRGLCTMRDHQNAMCFRLRLLQKKIAIEQKWIDVYAELTQKSELTIKLMIKYSLDSNIENVKKINVMLREIYETEKEILPEMIEYFVSICDNLKKQSNYSKKCKIIS